MAAKFSSFVLLLIVFILSNVTAYGQHYKNKDSVRLTDIKTLTLALGKKTTGQRTRPIPQLLCVGGTARCTYMPKAVQCYNKGSDGVSIQWECVADMDSNLRFGNVEVICEGYEYPEDDYVLAGSCGLEYTIDFVDPTLHTKKNFFSPPPPIPGKHKKSDDSASIIPVALMIIGVALIYFTCLRQPSVDRDSATPSAPAPGFRSDLFGDPPPEEPKLRPEEKQRSQGGRGFWSGFGLGNVSGYLLNKAFGWGNQQSTHSSRTSRRAYDGMHQSSSYDRRDRTPTPPRDSTPPSSSTTRLASGFGGTKRR